MGAEAKGYEKRDHLVTLPSTCSAHKVRIAPGDAGAEISRGASISAHAWPGSAAASGGAC